MISPRRVVATPARSARAITSNTRRKLSMHFSVAKHQGRRNGRVWLSHGQISAVANLRFKLSEESRQASSCLLEHPAEIEDMVEAEFSGHLLKGLQRMKQFPPTDLRCGDRTVAVAYPFSGRLKRQHGCARTGLEGRMQEAEANTGGSSGSMAIPRGHKPRVELPVSMRCNPPANQNVPLLNVQRHQVFRGLSPCRGSER